MGSTRAAVRYAKAVLDFSKDTGATKAVLNDMNDILATLDGSKELRLALNSPVIKSEDKRAILKEVFKDSSKETIQLIDTLIQNKRIDTLGNVAASYVAQYNKNQGVQAATVTTAVAITPELETKVLAKVTELTGSRDIKLENIVDESIIGGFVLRVGDAQYNASISSQLSKLKREFSNN